MNDFVDTMRSYGFNRVDFYSWFMERRNGWVQIHLLPEALEARVTFTSNAMDEDVIWVNPQVIVKVLSGPKD
jgi:hypothetical protein